MAEPGRCELCGARGRLRCRRCRRAYYCDEDHQQADWVGIHELICQLLIPTTVSLPAPLSEKERQHHREQLLKRQKLILGLAQSRAQQLVLEGKPKEALPAALCALRFSSRLHGSDSVQLVPAYLTLAEISRGNGDLQQAFRYLCQSQWIVLSTPGCSVALQALLHHHLGLFCAAKGSFEQALHHLSHEVYLTCSMLGPRCVEASGGYFHMAKVFLHQNKLEVADSLCAKVTSLWHGFLVRSLQAQLRNGKSPPEMSLLSKAEGAQGAPLTAAQAAEGLRLLPAVLRIRAQDPMRRPEETARTLQALAMLHYLAEDFPKAQEVGMKALELVAQLHLHQSGEAIQRLLELIPSKPSCTE
ncbi:zinc finger MYND domain-containing protein 12 [Dryobates pubescens]|uniref:zinc finger MYND domain-containing protein 12 n=1 Tax=Dryobates pubescens TaxID=118200 RepID=UPI0023B8C42C|nr:zinc finger MYND domain-containing protein 12 [Dryobates pubescens]